jgi:hypothetical protein
MWEAISAYAAGGQGCEATGGHAATRVLHFKQRPMPIIEERERVRVQRDIKE